MMWTRITSRSRAAKSNRYRRSVDTVRIVAVFCGGWFRLTRLVLAEHESRRDINGTVHDFMLFFLPAVIASDDYLKAPFRDTSFFMMKVRVLTENVLDHILCGTRHGVRVVISANLVNRV